MEEVSEGSYIASGKECDCRKPCVVRTSWTYENPGRRFYSCNYKKGGGCNFFCWVDGPMCTRSRQLIPGLLCKSNELHQILQEIQEENDKLKEENKNLAAEMKRLKISMRTKSKSTMWLFFVASAIILYQYLNNKDCGAQGSFKMIA
ncbi:zinc knuckle (CCHC-type) family protein [Striga hermonthica]|uniref:Zinc knuckle (CCHC-type) family protein n=1 Tax=Striga hermonthica TaxID=68872 RepID=A0A9N7MQB6_STRHE|nr:zinc knuckle (CCHC-type) family protein [Striga hermonthica]